MSTRRPWLIRVFRSGALAVMSIEAAPDLRPPAREAEPCKPPSPHPRTAPLSRFLSDTRGVVALEFAAIAVAMTPALLAGLNLGQGMLLRANLNYVTQAAATVAARQLSKGEAVASQAALDNITANKPMLFRDVTLEPTVTFAPDGSTVTVSVTATEPALVPVASFTSWRLNATATD